MITMKCYYTLFSKTGLIKNIGSYILLFTILVIMISAILFYKYGFHFLEEHIQNIMNTKERQENNKNKDINRKQTIDVKDNETNRNNKNNKNKKKKNKKKNKNNKK